MKTVLIKLAYILVLAFVCSANVVAFQLKIVLPETKVTQNPMVIEDSIYTVVDKMPQYIGGDAARIEFLKQNVKYPDKLLKDQQQGEVIVKFVVNSTGHIENAKVIKSVSPSLDQEALRVVNLFPDWIPGEQNGKKLSVYYTLPITFKSEEKSKNLTDYQDKNVVIILDGTILKKGYRLDNIKKEFIESIRYFKADTNEDQRKVAERYGPDALNGIIIIKCKLNNYTHTVDTLQNKKDSVDIFRPYSIIEQMPLFPGGEQEILNFIKINFQYPAESIKKKTAGKVVVRFIVSKTGKVRNVEIIRGISTAIDQEAIRVVSLLPNFIPGMQNNVNVPVYYTQPIVIKLQ